MRQEPPLQPRLHLRRTDTGVELQDRTGRRDEAAHPGCQPIRRPHAAGAGRYIWVENASLETRRRNNFSCGSFSHSTLETPRAGVRSIQDH